MIPAFTPSAPLAPRASARPSSPRARPHACARPPAPTRRLLLLAAAGAAAAAALSALRPSPASARPSARDDSHLSPAARRVLREGGTERPFSSPLLSESRAGVFACAACSNRLFASDKKYDSGTGWPSFTAALPGVRTRQSIADRALLQREVLCGECDGHLGHVFRDGPRPTRNRFCINGVALQFVPE